MGRKTKAHIRYKNKAGEIVPGVTTVLGVLNKPALVLWANRLGLKGVDSTKYRDEMADIGTLAHYLILCHLKGEKAETDDYSRDQIDKPETCLLKYWDWEAQYHFKPLFVEIPLVSEFFGFGGTIDHVAMNGGNAMVLVDYKTGKGIYEEMAYQLGAYALLLEEAGYPIREARILRIGRDENEGFEEKVYPNLRREQEIFLHCLSIYRLKK